MARPATDIQQPLRRTEREEANTRALRQAENEIVPMFNARQTHRNEWVQAARQRVERLSERADEADLAGDTRMARIYEEQRQAAEGQYQELLRKAQAQQVEDRALMRQQIADRASKILTEMVFIEVEAPTRVEGSALLTVPKGFSKKFQVETAQIDRVFTGEDASEARGESALVEAKKLTDPNQFGELIDYLKEMQDNPKKAAEYHFGWVLIYAMVWRKVLAACRAQVGRNHEDEARALAASALEAAYRRFSTYETREESGYSALSSFTGWVKKIAKNRYLNLQRKLSRHIEVSDIQEAGDDNEEVSLTEQGAAGEGAEFGASGEGIFLYGELREMLDGLLTLLIVGDLESEPPIPKLGREKVAAFKMHFFDEQDYRSISEVLGLSPATISRAVRAVAEALSQQAPEYFARLPEMIEARRAREPERAENPSRRRHFGQSAHASPRTRNGLPSVLSMMLSRLSGT
jgi:hypothetical protein